MRGLPGITSENEIATCRHQVTLGRIDQVDNTCEKTGHIAPCRP
jgi:hypothetical protein